MKKFLLISVLLSAVTACTPSAKKLGEDNIVLPEALKDCTMYRLMSSSGSHIYVLDCPHKSCGATATTGENPEFVNYCS